MKNVEINDELLKKILKLANLNIKENEEEKFLEDLKKIILEVEKLHTFSYEILNGQMVFQEVTNQYSQNKKMEIDHDLMKEFPLMREGMPFIMPIMEPEE